jgi:hypothetical protein
VSLERTLEGYTPPERFPPVTDHWVTARIREGVTSDYAAAAFIEGPITLSPPITDPAAPPTYNFTTRNAQLETGFYWVVWKDTTGFEFVSDPVERRAPLAYAPSVGEVAAILRARLVELGGVRVDTFTDRTEPSAQQVAQLIDLYAPMILSRLGNLGTLTCANASALRGAARALAAERVAIEVELSYRPEEVGESAAAAATVRAAQLDTDLTNLRADVDICRSSTETGTSEGSVSRSDAAYSFPVVPYLNW